MKSILLRSIFALAILLETTVTTYAMGAKDIKFKQIAALTFQSRKAAFVAAINKKLQNKDFHRGEFFKGEIPGVKSAANELAKQRLRVVESSKGITIIAGTGKNEVRVEMEFVDILAGKIRVSNEIVQLRANMSYQEVAQAIAVPIFRPFLKKQKHEKTSSLNPLNLFISPAWGQDNQGGQDKNEKTPVTFSGKDAGHVVGNTVWVASVTGLVAKIGSVLGILGTYKIILLAAAAVGAAGLYDFARIELSRVFSSKQSDAVLKVSSEFQKMAIQCESNGEDFRNNPAFEFLQAEIAPKEKGMIEGILDKVNIFKKDESELSCHELASELGLRKYLEKSEGEKGVGGFFKGFIDGESAASRALFRSRIKPLCETYQRIGNCMEKNKHLFGEQAKTKESAIDGQKGVDRKNDIDRNSPPASGQRQILDR